LKAFDVEKFLLLIVGLMLVAAAVTAHVKGVLVLAAIVIGLMLLARLYQAQPKAFYAVCIAAAAALCPKAVWPWVGITVMAWLAIELVHAIYTRLRRPAMSRFPSD
jgi:hypothetical protein